MPYSWIERRRIHRRAKAKLGLLKQSPDDEFIFMTQCVAQMVDEGSDPTEAQMICQLLYEEGNVDLWD